MNVLTAVARYLVGGLFIFSGLIKLNDPVGTKIKLEEYFDVFATDFAPFFASFIPLALGLAVLLSVLEVALGVAVLIRYRMAITTWVLLGMIVFFTFLTFYSAYFNKVTDCGCFGDAIVLTPWESFTKDIVLLVLIGVLFAYRHRFTERFSLPTSHWVVGAVTLLSLVVGITAVRHLPFADFRAYRVGADLPRLMQPSEPLRYKYIMTKNGEDEEFTQYPTDKAYTFKEMVALNPEAQPKITDYSVWNDEGDFTEGTFEGIKLLVVMYDVTKADKEALPKIQQLANQLPPDTETLVLTASGEAIYDEFRHDHQLALPYYYADATVLKTIIRANPGLVLLQNGVVRGKWHFRDTPSAEEISQLLGRGVAAVE
ncbi:MAG: BT_3928 family protein [Tunicatimonas sp.]